MFYPHTESERAEMLRSIGVQSIEDLFVDVPEKYRFPKLDLPPSLTEMEAVTLMQELANENYSTHDLICFLGAGAYNHYVPAVVDNLIRRGEFLTAYTPYQPEVSQGTLQAIFEYQSIIAALTGMDVSNASHYDGATAAAEAVVMAYHNFRGKRGKYIISPSLNPQFRQVINTYLSGYDNVSVAGPDELDPMSSPDELEQFIDMDTAMVIVQYPDFLGRIYDYAQLANKTHALGTLFAVVVNPLALALLKPPGEFGADVVVGEGQPLGIPMMYGGPYLGIFATKKEYVRKMAGRLVGETVDEQGKRGYVLTLTAREQHIRREKATSNICTNQGLIALASAIYVSLVGKQGLRQVAELCYHKAHYAAQKISQIEGYSLCCNAPYFHEFIVCCPKPVEEINAHLLEHQILGGYDLGKNFPSLDHHMLLAFTEMNSRDDIDLLCDVLAEVAND
ncbi:MAG: aminomethyl-transferring glycine dehydrogenase subunit GcvPA [Anaerolineae bacterium]|jgi:glycine dehydrogenase subunit 1|nr:aminomethyl-transferring glycine dehydrogenase subunit GcvPA [Anaerolineae bacterium]